MEAQKNIDTKDRAKMEILRNSQKQTWELLKNYISQNPEKAKKYDELIRSLREAEAWGDKTGLAKIRAQKLQFEQYHLIEWGLTMDEHIKKDVKDILKNRNGYESLKPSDVLLLRKKWVDIAPLLLSDPESPDASTTKESLRRGKSYHVNFWGHKRMNEVIGLGDILPPNIWRVRVTNGKKEGTEGSWKPYPRPWYYTDTGKYIPIYDGYTLTILDDEKTFTREEMQRNENAHDAFLTESRVYDMLESGVYMSENGVRGDIETMKKLFSDSIDDTVIFQSLPLYKNQVLKNSDTFLNPKNQREFLSKFQSVVDRECAARNIPPRLLLRLFQRESGFNPQAKNLNSSAHGLGQIIDLTWNELNRRIGPLDRNNPEHQIRATCQYLQDLSGNGKRDYADAFILYHTGPWIYTKWSAYIRSLKRINTPIAGMMQKYGLPDTAEGYMTGAWYYYWVNEFRWHGYTTLTNWEPNESRPA